MTSATQPESTAAAVYIQSAGEDASEMTFSVNDSPLLSRTKAYGLRVIRVVQSIQDDRLGRVLGDQLLRSGMSVGANYRSACRARSRADFVNKLKISEEECDEFIYWMELLVESGLMPEPKINALKSEGAEILAMLVASIQTARRTS